MADSDSDSDGFVPPPPPPPAARKAVTEHPSQQAPQLSRPVEPAPPPALTASKPQQPPFQLQPPTRPPAAAASSSAKAKTTVSGGGGLLSSLLSKLENTDKIREAISQVPQNVLTRQTEVKSRFEVWEAGVRQRLQAFAGNPELQELRFEPGLDKESTYVLHDVVTDHPDLVSANVGQYEERHVVVYRKGHQPADVEASGCSAAPPEMQQRLQARKAAAFRSAAAAAAAAVQAHPQLEAKLVKISGEKRDRRTIGEIQEEILKRKKHASAEEMLKL